MAFEVFDDHLITVFVTLGKTFGTTFFIFLNDFLNDRRVNGDELVISKLSEPMVLGSENVSKAIIGRKNIWKRSDSPIDTSVHWEASDYP